MLAIIENKLEKNILKLYLPRQKVLWKILEKVFITKKFTHYKTSRTLKIDVFEIPDNKNIEKLFSKYELVFLDQTNFSSDTSQNIYTTIPHT